MAQRGKPNGRPVPKSGAAGGRKIVLIDQEPLRRGAASRCAEAMSRLDAARSGWHRFEHEDKPAFARWRAREFGAILSEARDIETRIRECEAIVHEVEAEMRRFFQDPHRAYQRVMFRRAHPGEGDEARPAHATTVGGSGEVRRLSEFEQEALFQEWVQKSLGTHPDKMDDRAYSATFEAFKSHMFRGLPEQATSPRNQRPVAEEEARQEPNDNDLPRAIDARVKELYRKLVRRLHPDLRSDGITAASALWHEVQEAYAAGDVPQLEILLALSEVSADYMNAKTSLSQMWSLLGELDRSWRALEKSLREAEGEDAWNFARGGANDTLRVRVARDLKLELARRKRRLEELTRTIQAWSQPAGVGRS